MLYKALGFFLLSVLSMFFLSLSPLCLANEFVKAIPLKPITEFKKHSSPEKNYIADDLLKRVQIDKKFLQRKVILELLQDFVKEDQLAFYTDRILELLNQEDFKKTLQDFDALLYPLNPDEVSNSFELFNKMILQLNESLDLQPSQLSADIYQSLAIFILLINDKFNMNDRLGKLFHELELGQLELEGGEAGKNQYTLFGIIGAAEYCKNISADMREKAGLKVPEHRSRHCSLLEQVMRPRSGLSFLCGLGGSI